MITLSAGVLHDLKSGFAGTVISPTDAGYDGARRVWNAMIDKRPAVIARCANTADIVRSIAFARAQNLKVAVRGGGHHIAGNAV